MRISGCIRRISPTIRSQSYWWFSDPQPSNQSMNRGSRYTVKALHAGGLPDVANSLTVIKRLVYEERQLSLSELLRILERNWAENDGLKKRIQREIPLYGNDDATADAMGTGHDNGTLS